MNLLIAHPDDEVIFFWPILKEVKKIICCSSDENNPERQWCKDRKKGLEEVCNLINADLVCFPYNSEFYRMPTRDGSLMKFQEKILSEIGDLDICTHNPWGEYGHLDHILVSQIAESSSIFTSTSRARKIYTTSACLNAGWFEPRGYFVDISNNRSPKWTLYSYREIDLDFYNKCKSIYDKYNGWTWSKEPIKELSIYETRNCPV